MRKCDREMVKRIQDAVKKECRGCEYQDGKNCSWWRKQRIGNPPCQGNKQ